MNEKTYPSDLTDEEWEWIKDLIPAAKSGGRPRTLCMRAVLNAIFSVTKGGIQWRMLPTNFPKWQSVYHYVRAWKLQGVWVRIHDTLRARVRAKEERHKHPTAGCLDRQSVKTTEVGGADRGFDNGKKVKGRKRHVLVDTLGLLLIVVVTAASLSDQAGARKIFKQMRGTGKKLRKVPRSRGLNAPAVFLCWGHFIPRIVEIQCVTEQQMMGLDTIHLLDLLITYQ